MDRKRQKDSSHDDRRVDDKRYKTTISQEGTGGIKKAKQPVEIHPLLLVDDLSSFRDRISSSLAPKSAFATTLANQKAAGTAQPAARLQKKKELDATSKFLSMQPEDISRNNPYFDANLTASLRMREPRKLKFNAKGKFISRANQIRSEAQMQQLQKEIFESTKTAGVD